MVTLKYNIPAPFDMKIKLKISVSSEGIFGCTLPPEIAQLFLDHGIELELNRLRNPGYFSDQTLLGIKYKIGAKISELCSEDEISREKVIRYGIETNCSYAFGKDGEYLPNASARDDGGSDWHTGTKWNDATKPGPYGFIVYVKPQVKTTYQYCTGKTRVAYGRFYDGNPLGSTNADMARSDPGLWLALMPTISPGGSFNDMGSVGIKEIPYTHEAAMFFKNLMISIFKMNEQIKDFLEPDQIHKLIKAQVLGLSAPVAEIKSGLIKKKGFAEHE